MEKFLRVTLLALSCWLLSITAFTSFSLGLSPELEASFEHELRGIVAKHSRYVWGGSTAEYLGLDCSGFLFLAAKRAALPGVQRTTAYYMARGASGWTGRTKLLREVDPLDLVFFTWKPKPGKVPRPEGHVAAVLIGPKSRLLEFAHASSSKGVVLVPPFGLTAVSRVWHLTIGDKGVKK
jgi:hypothetical protein